MSGLAIIQCEGVLGEFHENPNAMRPSADGYKLYEGVRRGWTNVCVASTVFDPEALKRWLKINGFAKWEKLECKSSSSAMPPAEWVGGHMVDVYRSNGWEVGPVVSSDPTVVRLALMRGVPAWLVAHPTYMRPEHRPDAVREPRAWDSLVAEVERQHEMKLTDNRLEAEDVIGGSRPD